jgi:predicted HicB family RNase H-like nuclease
MARPAEYENRVNMGLRLSEELYQRVEEEAKRRDISRNLLIEKILSKHLPSYEEQEI